MGNEQQLRWSLDRIQGLIDDKTPESFLLEYKASWALDKSAANEITKDVSSFANSAGGTIIYGVAEDPNQRELPGSIDEGTDPKRIRREWIEDVIKNIRPRIDGILIHPIPLQSGHYVYVVEVPQGATAHQASDKKYYKRMNFSSEPMFDHEIRDVMNRIIAPIVSVRFGFRTRVRQPDLHKYNLTVELKNEGFRRVSTFKLSFWFPRGIEIEPSSTLLAHGSEHVDGSSVEFSKYSISPNESFVLFPQDTWKLEENGLRLAYRIDSNSFNSLARRKDSALRWRLWIDDALPQKGTVPFDQLNEF